MAFRRRTNRKRSFRRRRRPIRRTMFKRRMMRKLRLLSSPEFKHHDINRALSSMSPSDTYSFTRLTNISQDSTVGTRIGNKCTVRKLMISGTVANNSGVDESSCHIALVMIPAGQVFENLLPTTLYTKAISGLRNLTENQNLKVLAQKRVQLAAFSESGSTKRFVISKKVHTVIEYVPSSDQPATNAFYLVESFYSVSSTPSIQFTARIYWTDS